MRFREIELPTAVPGRLLLHSMPGRYESWAGFLTEARTEGVSQVACLASTEEVARKSPQYAAAIEAGEALPFALHHLPMPDFGVPSEPKAFHAGVDALAAELTAGAVVLVHCGAGIGRTGTVAVCVLRRLGVDLPLATEKVRAAGSGPETAEQEGLVESFAPGKQHSA